MTTASESIHIEAPVDVVYAFLDNPHNHAEVTPSLAEVRNVEPLENGGKRVEHTYGMAGISLEGELVEREHVENELMLFEMRGNLTGEIRIETKPEGDGTRVQYTGTYDLPGRVLGRVAEPLARRYNVRELRQTLENTKTHIESNE